MKTARIEFLKRRMRLLHERNRVVRAEGFDALAREVGAWGTTGR